LAESESKVVETEVTVEQIDELEFKIIRNRKKEWQISILKEAFKDDEVWSIQRKISLGKSIGMTYHQVSKWHWDERKKRGIDTTKKRHKKDADKNLLAK